MGIGSGKVKKVSSLHAVPSSANFNLQPTPVFCSVFWKLIPRAFDQLGKTFSVLLPLFEWQDQVLSYKIRCHVNPLIFSGKVVTESCTVTSVTCRHWAKPPVLPDTHGQTGLFSAV